MRKINRELKKIMLDAGIYTQAELAVRVGVTPRMIAYVLHDEKPSKPCIYRAARVLGITSRRLRQLIQNPEAT